MLQSQPLTRIWELDFLRGIAISLMVFFHLIYDLNEFYNVAIGYEDGIVYYIGKAAASLFIVIAGISCSLSKNTIKRGLKLLALGFLITITTSIAVPGSNIFFGILHFLGVSVLLFSLFKHLRPYALLLLGTIILFSGFFLHNLTLPTNLLAPLGLTAENFFSVDYYPLMPWLGLFLYGIALGKLKYREKKSLFKFDQSKNTLVLAGKHSLFIYLVHQPIILLLLFLFYQLRH